MSIIKKINDFLFNYKTLEELYLENSRDICDLEKRQKQLMLGQAPFQKYGNMKARYNGW